MNAFITDKSDEYFSIILLIGWFVKILKIATNAVTVTQRAQSHTFTIFVFVQSTGQTWNLKICKKKNTFRLLK